MSDGYLSTDPNAGMESGGYLSTDPNAGDAPRAEQPPQQQFVSKRMLADGRMPLTGDNLKLAGNLAPIAASLMAAFATGGGSVPLQAVAQAVAGGVGRGLRSVAHGGSAGDTARDAATGTALGGLTGWLGGTLSNLGRSVLPEAANVPAPAYDRLDDGLVSMAVRNPTSAVSAPAAQAAESKVLPVLRGLVGVASPRVRNALELAGALKDLAPIAGKAATVAGPMVGPTISPAAAALLNIFPVRPMASHGGQ